MTEAYYPAHSSLPVERLDVSPPAMWVRVNVYRNDRLVDQYECELVNSVPQWRTTMRMP